MNAGRAFSLLVGLAMLGLVLFVAATIRLALGALPGDVHVHKAADGLCVIVPTHGDFFAHSLSYGSAILLLVVSALAARYVGQQTKALRSFKKAMVGAVSGKSVPRLKKVIADASLRNEVILLPAAERVAFTAGLWRPRIFVSAGLVDGLNDQQLEAVLLHEEHHAQRRDPFRALVARSLAMTLFFLPILRDMSRYYHIGKEIEADAAAVRQQRSRAHIASALCALGASNAPGFAGAVGFGEASSIQARIDALRTGHWHGKPFLLSTLLWSVIGVAVMTALVAHPVTGAQEWWGQALSLTACPLWLLLYWVSRSRPG